MRVHLWQGLTTTFLRFGVKQTCNQFSGWTLQSPFANPVCVLCAVVNLEKRYWLQKLEPLLHGNSA
jgi:hypothetical protein